MSQLPKRYECRRAYKKVNLTGEIHDPAWAAAAWTDNFVDIEGDKKPMPRFSTQAKMLWDDEFFYVAALMEEPHVWATLTEHDSVIFHDNDFEVFIDPDGDGARYFEFEMNALNTTWDLYLDKSYRNGGHADNSWESHAKSAVSVHGTINSPTDTDTSWRVEVAFPWECFRANGGMRCPPKGGDVWRVNFSRVEWQVDIVDGKYVKKPGLREDNWVWSPQGVIDMHIPEHWGYVTFVP